MKIKSYKFILIFVISIILLIADNIITTKNIKEQIETYEEETLESIDDYIDGLIEYKKNSLYQLSKTTMNDNKVQMYMSSLTSNVNSSNVLIQNIDYVLYNKNAKIFYNIDGSIDGYEFSKDELVIFKKIYDSCCNYVNFYNSNQWIKTSNGYELLFGMPIYDDNYDIYGSAISRVTSEEIYNYINTIIDNDNIYLKVISNDEIIAELNPNLIEEYTHSRKTDDEIYCKHCNADIFISISDKNIHPTYSITNVVFIGLSFLLTIVYFILWRIYKNEFPLSTIAIIILTVTLVNAFSIIAFKFYDLRISNVKLNTASKVYLNSINYEYDTNTQLIIKLYEQIKYDVSINDNVNENNVIEYVKNKYGKNFKSLLNIIENAGHIYLYDSQKQMTTIPYNKYSDYVSLPELNYEDYKTHNNQEYAYIEYDENYNCNILYYNCPIIKNDKLIMTVSCVFDYDKIKNNIIKESKFDSIEYKFIDSSYNLYSLEKYEMKYLKKYSGTLETFDSIKWSKELQNREYILKYVDKYGSDDRNAIYSDLLNGIIVLNDEKGAKWIFIAFKIFFQFILILIGTIIVLINDFTNIKMYFKNKKENNKIKNENII